MGTRIRAWEKIRGWAGSRPTPQDDSRGAILAVPQLPRRSLHIRRKTPRLNTHRFTTFVALVISCWKSECRLSSSFLFLPIQDFWYSVSREY